jgi:hypothetical protein
VPIIPILGEAIGAALRTVAEGLLDLDVFFDTARNLISHQVGG